MPLPKRRPQLRERSDAEEGLESSQIRSFESSCTHRPDVAFHQLLVWLREQHDFELAAMRKENLELRRNLDGTPIEELKDSTPQDLPNGDIGPERRHLISEEEIHRPSLTAQRSVTVKSFHLRIKDEWREESRPSCSFCFDSSQDVGLHDSSRSSRLFKRGTSQKFIQGFKCRVIHPTSSIATCWSSSSFLVVLFDLLLIPLQAFRPPRDWFFISAGWFTQIYWNVDLCVSFCFGYYHNEIVVLEFRKAVTHYLKTWFLLDSTIVSLDWLMFALESERDAGSGTFSRFAKTLKTLKALRLIRLLKTAKVMRATETIEEFVSSDVVQHFSVVKIIIAILLLNHLVACIWYRLGDTEDGSGWVQLDEIGDWTFFRRYSTSYHWSLTQLGVGESMHNPSTMAELVFSNIVLIVGLIVISSLISGFTNTVAALHKLRASHVEQFRLLRKFCRDHEIPYSLSRRVKIYLEHKLDRMSQKVQQSQITMFKYLSEPLQAEINESMYLEHLHSSLFIQRLFELAPAMVRKIALHVLTSTHLSRQDLLFSRGELAFRALVMFSGKIEYEYHDRKELVPVFEFQWVSHAALWLQSWLHTGTLKAVADSELLSVESRSLLETVRTQVQAWETAHQFAKQFCEGIEAETEPSDLYDLNFEGHGLTHQLLERSKTEISWLRRVCCWWRP